MHPDRITQIIQFALAKARREDFGIGDLGVIHLLKVLYLADLAYAQTHAGETYTDIQWVFHNFGPWSKDAWGHTVDVLEAPEIEPHTQIASSFERKTYRFRDEREGDEVFFSLERSLPPEVSQAVGAAVHEYGSDTKGLLHYVYNTAPMRATVPGDRIDFTGLDDMGLTQARAPQMTAPTLSITQQKKADHAKALLRESIAAKAAARQAARIIPLPTLNEKELAALEELTRILSEDEDQAPTNLHGELVFSPEFWRSDFRREHGLP